MTDVIDTEVKRFGAKERPKAHEFELITFTDDGGTNTHRFRMVPLIPAGQVTAIMDALDDEPEKMFGLIARLMARVLDNTDGVPANWVYDEFEDPAPDDDGYDPDLSELYFVGPDNETYPAIDADRYTAFGAGSSRRRWTALMDPANDDEGVQLGDMMDLAKWVVGLATDRPTQARTSSTRGSRKIKR
jgi:hypothetical protein